MKAAQCIESGAEIPALTEALNTDTNIRYKPTLQNLISNIHTLLPNPLQRVEQLKKQVEETHLRIT